MKTIFKTIWKVLTYACPKGYGPGPVEPHHNNPIPRPPRERSGIPSIASSYTDNVLEIQQPHPGVVNVTLDGQAVTDTQEIIIRYSVEHPQGPEVTIRRTPHHSRLFINNPNVTEENNSFEF